MSNLDVIKRAYAEAKRLHKDTFEVRPEIGQGTTIDFGFFDESSEIANFMAEKNLIVLFETGELVKTYTIKALKKDKSKVYKCMSELIGLRNKKYTISEDFAGDAQVFGNAHIESLDGAYEAYLSTHTFYKTHRHSTERTLNRYGFGHLLLQYN